MSIRPQGRLGLPSGARPTGPTECAWADPGVLPANAEGVDGTKSRGVPPCLWAGGVASALLFETGPVKPSRYYARGRSSIRTSRVRRGFAFCLSFSIALRRAPTISALAATPKRRAQSRISS